MLNGVHLVDFGNHRNTRLTFGRMAALVGQNGVGKTTVMRAVGEVGQAARSYSKRAVAPVFVRVGCTDAALSAGWLTRGTSEDVNWGVRLGDGFEWQARTLSAGGGDVTWMPEPLVKRQKQQSAVGLRERIVRALEVEVEAPPSDALRTVAEAPFGWLCRYFKTSASSLQRPAFADPQWTKLDDSGSNLAWALASLMTEHPERFQTIVEALREVVPVVKRIRSRPVSLTRAEKQTVTINKQERTFDEERSVPGQELLFDMLSGDNLPATMVSEGTLVALAVLTLVHGTDEADLIMLDDVELGLHPKAQRDLIRQLRRIQETHPQLQIILSTHSPYVVDEMKPEEVWLFAPDAEGCAVARRLDEHPNAKRALEVLTTGEFWSAEGEGWVLDAANGAASPEPSAKVAEEPPQG